MNEFKETQWFNRWFMLLTLLIPLGIMLYCIYAWYIQGVGVDKVPADDYAGQALVLGLLGFTCLFMFSLQLHSKIDQDGIHYRYLPFILRWRKLSWYDIESCELKTYAPISDYGGWGIKKSWNAKPAHWSYTISGNQGLFIVLRSGKSLLLGTRKAAEAERVVQYHLKKRTHES